MSSSPSVDPSFARDLDDYSRQATGMPGQYRPYWLAKQGIWSIQRRVPGEEGWQPIIGVFDVDQDAEFVLKYRPLDRRAILDLIEADLANKWFATGDIKKDHALFAAWKTEMAKMREEVRFRGVHTKIEDLYRDADWHRRRLAHAAETGHLNGFKSLHAVPAGLPAADDTKAA